MQEAFWDEVDVVPDGLGRAETLCDDLVGLAAHEHEEDFQLALGQPGAAGSARDRCRTR